MGGVKGETVTLTAADQLDLECRFRYGDESGFVEKVLPANPGLAAIPPHQLAGVSVFFPNLAPAEPVLSVVTLYD